MAADNHAWHWQCSLSENVCSRWHKMCRSNPCSYVVNGSNLCVALCLYGSAIKHSVLLLRNLFHFFCIFDICRCRAYSQGFAMAVHMSNDRQHFDPAFTTGWRRSVETFNISFTSVDYLKKIYNVYDKRQRRVEKTIR